MLLPSIREFLQKPVQRQSSWFSIFVFIFLIFYSAVGSVAISRWDDRSNKGTDDLGFGYGVLIKSISQTGEYRVCGVHHPDVCFSAHRLPLIPYGMLLLSQFVGDNLATITLVKSLMFGGLLWGALLPVMRHASVATGWFLLGMVFLLSMPRWGLTFFELSVEEAYLSVPLGLLVSCMLFATDDWWRSRWSGVFTGIILVSLLFLKNSMPYLCIAMPIIIWWWRRNLRSMSMAMILVVLGILGLSWFNLSHSGRWTFGSSWAGWNLYKGNNELTADYYPRYSLDLLDYEGGVSVEAPITDEWDYDAKLKAKAVDFIRANPGEFIRLCLVKAGVLLIDVRPNGAQRESNDRAGMLKTLQVGWMVLFRLMLWTVILYSIFNLWRRSSRDPRFCSALFFCIFLAVYGGFYVIGFAYERHVVPLMLPTLLCLWHLQSVRRENSNSV